jgi:twitching motility protein PilT
MIPVKNFLSALARAEVAEVCLEAGKKPVARVGGATEIVADEVVSPDDLLQILFQTGGSRYVDTLADKPAQWRTRVEGVGAVVVSAAMRGDAIEARFALKDAPVDARGLRPDKPGYAPDPPAATPAPPAARAPEPKPANKASRGPRSARGGAPSSRRARGGKARASNAPEAPVTPRGDELEVELEPHGAITPRANIAPPREAMPSNYEIELDIGANEIPSIPHPEPLDLPPAKAPPAESPAPPPVIPRARAPVEDTGPISPRTLPEARFTRDPEPRKPPEPTRKASAPVVVTPTPAAPPAVPNLAPARVPLDLDATSEPFAPRQPSAPPPASPSMPPVDSAPSLVPRISHRPSARTTRPFMREPYTPLYRRLLRLAREVWASDLHLVGDRAPVVRVAGQLVVKGEPIEAKVVEDMILSRIPGRLMASFEQEGSCDFALDEPELGRFRVNASRQRTGVKASFRLVMPQVPTLAQLGMPDAIAAATRHHQGLVVLTGPAGHGKTATLAALVDLLNAETTRHILTIEDPIEHLLPKKRALMSQREIGTHVRSFSAGLKAALREDPDVIVVGELRDTETVRMALTASETGHLVIGTMSTPSAAKTIDRLVDLFPPADHAQVRTTLAGGLKLIVGQRLLPNREGTGMVAAAEVLPGMVPLWNLIRENRTYQIPSLQQRGRALGVIRLDDSLADLVRAGKVTPQSALAVAEAPDELEQTLGIRRASVQMPRQTAPVRPPDPSPSEPRTGEPKGLFERAGALFKKGT